MASFDPTSTGAFAALLVGFLTTTVSANLRSIRAGLDRVEKLITELVELNRHRR